MSVNAQGTKYALAIAPLLVNNASATAIAVDTLGFDYAEVVTALGVTDIALTALKVTECDTSGGTYTDVTGAIWGTSTNIAGTVSALPTSTDDNHFFVADLDVRARKRYLKVVATVGNGSVGANIASWVNLSRGEITPVNAADRGVTSILRA